MENLHKSADRFCCNKLRRNLNYSLRKNADHIPPKTSRKCRATTAAVFFAAGTGAVAGKQLVVVWWSGGMCVQDCAQRANFCTPQEAHGLGGLPWPALGCAEDPPKVCAGIGQLRRIGNVSILNTGMGDGPAKPWTRRVQHFRCHLWSFTRCSGWNNGGMPMHGRSTAFLADKVPAAPDLSVHCAVIGLAIASHPFSRSPRGLSDVSTSCGYAEC